MTTYFNSYEGGTNGTTLNPTSSGSGGTAFNAVSSGVTFDNTHVAHGAMAAKFDATGTGIQSADVTGLNTAAIAMRDYFYFTANPVGSATPQIQWMGTAAQTRLVSLIWNNTGTISVSITGAGVVYTSTGTVPLNAQFRSELRVKINGTSGEVHFAGYAGDSTTPITGMSYDSTTANLGTTNVGEIRRGRTVSNAYPNAFWVDDSAWNDAAAGFIGPYVSSSPTTLVTSQFAGVCVVDARNTTTEVGGALTFTWTQSSGPASTPVQLVNGLWYITPDTATDLVYTLSVSEAGGHTSSGTITVAHQATGNPSGTAQMLWFNGTAFV
jgi:hypothetical protein